MQASNKNIGHVKIVLDFLALQMNIWCVYYKDKKAYTYKSNLFETNIFFLNDSTWHVGYIQNLPPLELPRCHPFSRKISAGSNQYPPGKCISHQTGPSPKIIDSSLCQDGMGYVTFHEGFHLRRIFVGNRLVGG